MGGVSGSVFRPSGRGTALFTGLVSRENNGGFASIRSPESDFQLDGFDGVELRLFSDGRTYKVNLRTRDVFDDVQYQAPASCAAGEWSNVCIPFGHFQPVLRGRPRPGTPRFDPRKLRTIGLVIADGQEGEFRLEIRSIAGYRITQI